MFEEAELGRIDALVTNTPVILAGIAAGEPLVLCGEPLYYENASFTLAQGGADWRAVLNDCIETMHSSGCLEEKSVLWNNGLDLTVSLPAEFDLQLWEETLPSGVDYLPLGLMLRRGQSGLHVRLRFNVSE